MRADQQNGEITEWFQLACGSQNLIKNCNCRVKTRRKYDSLPSSFSVNETLPPFEEFGGNEGIV